MSGAGNSHAWYFACPFLQRRGDQILAELETRSRELARRVRVLEEADLKKLEDGLLATGMVRSPTEEG
jgi:hypothetical protein